MNFTQRLESDHNDELLVAKDKKYSANVLVGNWPSEKLQENVSWKITIWKRFLLPSLNLFLLLGRKYAFSRIQTNLLAMKENFFNFQFQNVKETEKCTKIFYTVFRHLFIFFICLSISLELSDKSSLGFSSKIWLQFCQHHDNIQSI